MVSSKGNLTTKAMKFSLILALLVLGMQPISAEEQFYVEMEDYYGKGGFISIRVTGPRETPFSIAIISPSGDKVFSKITSTDRRGIYNLYLPGYGEEGCYTLTLISGEKEIFRVFGIEDDSCSSPAEGSGETGDEEERGYETPTQPTEIEPSLPREEPSVRAPPISSAGGMKTKPPWYDESIGGGEVKSLAMAGTETTVGETYILSTHGTRMKLVGHHDSPTSQGATYALYDDRGTGKSYIAVAAAAGGNLKGFKAYHMVSETETVTIDDYEIYEGNLTSEYPGSFYDPPDENDTESFGKTFVPVTRIVNFTKSVNGYDETRLVMNTNEFRSLWNGTELYEVKEFMQSKGLGTDLESLLSPHVIPQDGENVYIYEVTHPAGGWEYFEYEIDANVPHKFLAFDPAGGAWWNTSWAYRRNLTISEPDSVARTWQQTIVNLTNLDAGNIENCTEEIRVLDENDNEVNVRVVADEGDRASSPYCTIEFGVTISASGSKIYTVYYGNPDATAPSYATRYLNLTWIKSAVYFTTDDLGTPGDTSDYPSPVIIDYDCDGDNDFVYGMDDGRIYWRQNTGTDAAPNWAGAVYLGIDVGNDADPDLDDILDSDGDLDLAIGEAGGRINIYRNTGTCASPTWSSNNTSGNYGANTRASAADMDNDGDLDVPFGENSQMQLYENTGSPTSPSWSRDTTTMPTTDYGTFIDLSVRDLDFDGDNDIIFGDSTGIIRLIWNNGTAGTPDWYEPPIQQKYSDGTNIDVGTYSTPYLADVNKDGYLDIVTGEATGYIRPSTDAGDIGKYLRNSRLTTSVGSEEVIQTTNVSVIQLEHENYDDYSLDEYETGDNIEWVNVTIRADAFADSTNVTLNVLDSSNEIVSWFSTETKQCGDLYKDNSCELEFNNSGSGYTIATDESAGTYKWNVTSEWANGNGGVGNTSKMFTIRNLPNGFASSLNPVSIIVGSSATYSINITNTWSTGVTVANVTINCPSILGMNCTCIGTGLPYCDLGGIAPGATETATFNITTNSSTPGGTYNINATVNYTNPGNEVRSWSEQQNKVLQVSSEGSLIVLIHTLPATLTRNAGYAVKGYTNNTGEDAAGVWLNWTLPTSWTNSSGTENKYIGNLTADAQAWNNMTANVPLAASLGVKTVYLKSNSSDGRGSQTSQQVTVYANTSLTDLWTNNSAPVRGETIKIRVQLLYDTGAPVASQTVTFRDETQGQDIGTNTTNANGYVTKKYTIPGNAALGAHTINITYAGSAAKYTNQTDSQTTITVHDIPSIRDVSASPQTVGYGYTVTIDADVADGDGVDTVRVYITPPGSGATAYGMTPVGGNTYGYNYTNTWKRGTYSYYVWANDTEGNTNQSSAHYFYVKANATMSIQTDKNSYGPNQDVRLLWQGTWTSSDQENGTIQKTAAQNESVFYDGFENWGAGDCAHGGTWDDCYVGDGSIQRTVASVSNGSYAVWFYDHDSDDDYLIKCVDLSSYNKAYVRFAWRVIGLDDGEYGKVDVNTTSEGWTNIWTSPGGTTSWATTTVNVTDNISSDTCFNLHCMAGQPNEYCYWDDFRVVGEFSPEQTTSFTEYTSIDGSDFDYVSDVQIIVTVDSYDPGGSSAASNIRPDLEIGIWDGSSYDTGHFCSISSAMGSDALNTTDYNCTINTYDSTILNAWKTAANRRIEIRGRYMDGKGGYDDKIDYTNVWVKVGRNSILKNIGNTNTKGYLLMRIQKQSGGSWTNVGLPIVDQGDGIRIITSGNYLNLSQIWDDEGGWNAALQAEGAYRVYSAFINSAGTVLKNDDSSNIEDTYNFNIIAAQVKLTELEHENNDTYFINEYETRDTIAWINTTILVEDTDAVAVNVTLGMLDSDEESVSWGPNETQECGNIAQGDTCEKEFDNSSQGYPIPANAVAGTYIFTWNATIEWATGYSQSNYTNNFTLHHVPASFSGSLSDSKIFQNETSIYNFSFTNPWGSTNPLNGNLTNVNVSINLPQGVGMVANCTLPGQENNRGYCYYSKVEASQFKNATFNITTNVSTSAGDYNVNVTIEYTNPGTETRTWSEQQNQVLKVRIPGQFVIIYSYPATVTRQGTDDLKGYVNNTLEDTQLTDVWLNWTLPSGWTNQTGNLSEYNATLSSGSQFWNNITASVGLGAALGSQQIELRSSSAEGYNDWEYAYIAVYANTILTDLSTNQSNPERGETIKIYATLEYDNGTGIGSETVSFRDETEGQDIGTNTTNANGYVTKKYTIPGNAALGAHTINITYAGYAAKYTNQTDSQTTITVHDIPSIRDVSASPQTLGYGQNVTIGVNVTDPGDGVDSVEVYITPPGGSATAYGMSPAGGDIYEYSTNETWIWGTWSYYIWANDTEGNTNQSSAHYFYVKANATIDVATDKDEYGPNEDVYLDAVSWFDQSWERRKPVTITENSGNDLTNHQVNLTIDTQSLINDNKLQGDCDDIRFALYNGTELSYWIESGCNTASTIVWVKVPSITDSSTATIYFYYDNPSASAGSNLTATMDAYTEGIIKQGSTAGGSLSFSFPSVSTKRIVPNSTNLDMYMAGDFAAVNEYATVTANGNNLGDQSTDFDDCTMRQPAGWPKNVTGNVSAGALSVIADASAAVNADPASCGFYYKYNFTVTGYSRKYRSPEPTFSLGNEEVNYSHIANSGSTNITGYLLMQVQYNNSGTWQVISTRVNDTATGTLRTIENRTFFNLETVWNADPWNTDLESEGTYRAYVALVNSSRHVMRDDSGQYMNDTYDFDLVPPAANVNILKIYAYNVTGLGNTHAGGTLMDHGLNTAISLYTNELYRIELVAQNDAASTSGWTITASDLVYHGYLNTSWTIDQDNDVWYNNGTNNFTGGTWANGNVTWNTALGGVVQVGNNVTFYYVFNVTNPHNGTAHFMINSANFVEEDYSRFDIAVQDIYPPWIYDNVYGMNQTGVNRGNLILGYAKWNETVAEAKAEFNSTTSVLGNWSVDNLPRVWTNYTVTTTSAWVLGVHWFKFYAKDNEDNWNIALSYLSFEVWGWAEVSSSSLNDSQIELGEQTLMKCRVTSDAGSGTQNYNVTFYNSTHYLGSALTNSTGWAEYAYTATSLGYETLRCNITDDAAKYYNASYDDNETKTVQVIETEKPKYFDVSANMSKVYKGEQIEYRARWTDNYELAYGALETNETGVWQNSSLAGPVVMSGTGNWSNFTVTMPQTVNTGIIGWKIWSNDTSGNLNYTNINTTELWAWVRIVDISLSPGVIEEGQDTLMRCRVQQENGTDVPGYNVSFYTNESGYLGQNWTQSDGWVQYRFTDNTNGTTIVICNITVNSTAYMGPRRGYENATKPLTVKNPGEDVTPPWIKDGNYGLNDTEVYKGNQLLAYAQWNETVGDARARLNTTSSSLANHSISGPYTGNWTNYTIDANATWIVGHHVIKLAAEDNFGNWNNSMSYLEFDVYGYSNVTWYGPTGTVARGNTSMMCQVKDYNGNYAIENYPVKFYDPGWEYLGLAVTNSSGIAMLYVNTSAYSPGQRIFTCTIEDNDTLYYEVTVSGDEDFEALTLMGQLNITIDAPANESNHYKGSTVNLQSTTRDELGAVVGAPTVTWRNSTKQVATGEDTSWDIPNTHSIGAEIMTANSTKQYYYSDETNVTIYVWGYSNLTWGSPAPWSEYSQGTSVTLICLVEDNMTNAGIQNYPVQFYVENSTHTYSLGSNLSNSTGYATKSWDTSSYAAGVYFPVCNITDNSSLYYNASAHYGANSTVNITAAAGVLLVTLNTPPGDSIVPRYRNFTVNATVECSNSDCGNVQGTARYNSSSASADTTIPASGTPFYTFDSNPQSCTENPMTVGENCTLTWVVNSTGNFNTVWVIDALFTGSTAQNNDTDDSIVTIGKVMLVDFSTDTIDWGLEDPGQTDVAAPGNPYQVSLDDNSNDADGIYIKGTNLTNASLTTYIGVGNLSWNKNNSPVASTELNGTYTLVQSSVSSGTDIDMYFWLDTPAVYAGKYEGTMTIMANASY
jgi:hypothetical protein